MKKLIMSTMCALLFFSLCSCDRKEKLSSEEFEKWSKDIATQLVSSEDYNVYSIIENPKEQGFKMDVKGLSFITHKEYKEALQNAKKELENLENFNYEELNKDQKITYDVLEAYFEDSVDAKDQYYLSTNYFDVSSGVQSNLPLNLYFMNASNQEALDAYLNVMESTSKMFPKYVSFEQTRQDKGFGMSKTYMEEVIQQVHTFNAQDHSYIVDGIGEEIEEATFLSEEEKLNYKDTLQRIYEQNFIPAYQQLEMDLQKIEIKTKDRDASLADYTGGKKYYASLIKDATGFESVKEYRKFLSEQIDEISYRAQELLYQYPELQTEFLNPSLEDPLYTNLDSVSEVLAFLEEKMNTGKDFPKLENVQYAMDIVPAQLQEIFKATAAYFIGPLDNPEAPEQMILNGNFSQSDYNTIAHEGFPGHMYQFHYFRNTKHNIIRDLLANRGYTEGWAVYASKQMSKYAQDPAMVAFQELNEDMTYLYILEIDAMIHYDNVPRSEIYKYFEDKFGIENVEDMKTQYEQLLEGPALFAPYYGSYFRLLELKEEAKTKWDKYSNYKFHKKMLDLGALPYDLLEEYMID